MPTPLPTYRVAPRRGRIPAILLWITICFAAQLHGQTVAVAANAQALLKDLSRAYRAASGADIESVVAASGVLTAQIRNGAPFDVFLSADTSYPMSLWREGRAEAPRVYAYGRLILWTKSGVPLAGGVRALLNPSVRAVAVANPRNAPFGAAAVEALRRAGILDSVHSKIVYGESIAQVNQYVDTRAAGIGITASSAPFSAAPGGEWAPVDTALYAPIPQAAAVLRRGTPEREGPARAFVEFLFSAEARAIFRRYGYALP
jgi:molybdate transport system substrate-binding protein